jgi:hypothetical protein
LPSRTDQIAKLFSLLRWLFVASDGGDKLDEEARVLASWRR